MGIEWFRDLVICILGIITIAFLIFIAVLAYSLYRKSQSLVVVADSICKRANSILDTIQSTSEDIRGIVANIEEAVVSPVAQIVAIIQGIRQGINMVNRLFNKEEEAENE